MNLITYFLVQSYQVRCFTDQSDYVIAHSIFSILNDLSEILSNDTFDLLLKIIIIKFILLKELIDI